MENFNFFITILFSDFLILFLAFFLKSQKKNQIVNCFYIMLFLMFIWTFSLTLQLLLQNTNIEPVFFEGLASFGAEFISLAFLALGTIFSKTKLTFNKKQLLLLIIPIVSIILMFTNDSHHLYYINYSTNLANTIPGPYMTLHSIYSYSIFAIAIWIFLRYSIKNAGFFSKQSLLIILGALIPIVVNILGTFQIIPMTVYVTPICFAFTIVIFALAIFKFKFLSITPIAMQRIVDRMSDSFVVVNEENMITDFNDTYLKTFRLTDVQVRNMNFIDLIKKAKFKTADVKEMEKLLIKCKSSTQTFQFKRNYKIKNNYFNIEVNGIYSKDTFLGNLILFKDVTQHIIDMQTIEENQSMLMEKERLASLGQMIGGIAHNLKTPIMSIAGASEGLSELTHEYDISIGDPEVTNEDHHAIVKDMDEWIRKIREYSEYMSDVITAVKGQAVNFSDETSDSFTINEAIKYIDVLMKHELKNALIDLNVHMLTDPSITIKGNINSFVQVINNMISNAIQSYNGEPNKDIDFTIDKVNNNIQFMIQDYGCGIPQSVQDKLFKEMITTKGKNGTGLGLFMSYSNIRAHFNGNVTFESEEGKGTKFVISIPVN